MLITRKTVLPTARSIMLILNFMNYLEDFRSHFVPSQRKTYKWHNTTYIITLYLSKLIHINMAARNTTLFCNVQGVGVYTNVSRNYMFRPLLNM
jgi:hypothetical protein